MFTVQADTLGNASVFNAARLSCQFLAAVAAPGALVSGKKMKRNANKITRKFEVRIVERVVHSLGLFFSVKFLLDMESLRSASLYALCFVSQSKTCVFVLVLFCFVLFCFGFFCDMEVCLLVGCLTSQEQAGVSAMTILRAATLRYKLRIKLSTSPSHSILTPGRPIPALTL